MQVQTCFLSCVSNWGPPWFPEAEQTRARAASTPQSPPLRAGWHQAGWSGCWAAGGVESLWGLLLLGALRAPPRAPDGTSTAESQGGADTCQGLVTRQSFGGWRGCQAGLRSQSLSCVSTEQI